VILPGLKLFYGHPPFSHGGESSSILIFPDLFHKKVKKGREIRCAAVGPCAREAFGVELCGPDGERAVLICLHNAVITAGCYPKALGDVSDSLMVGAVDLHALSEKSVEQAAPGAAYIVAEGFVHVHKAFLLRKVLPESAAQQTGKYLAAPADGKDGLALPQESADKGQLKICALRVQHNAIVENGLPENFGLDILASAEQEAVAYRGQLFGAVLGCDYGHSACRGKSVRVGAAENYLPCGIGTQLRVMVGGVGNADKGLCHLFSPSAFPPYSRGHAVRRCHPAEQVLQVPVRP